MRDGREERARERFTRLLERNFEPRLDQIEIRRKVSRNYN